MPRKVVVFSDLSQITTDHLSDLLERSYLVCDRVAWDQSGPLDFHEADVIVLWGATVPDGMAHALNVLKRHPVDRPTLAILPENPDSGLIKLASESTDDFMLSPIRKSEFQRRLERMLGPDPNIIEEVARRVAQELAARGLIGKSPAFLQTLSRIPLAARTNTPVLIVGETGTGKELIARAIHDSSTRRDSAFIPVDCASIPDHLFENELFGHARGAFTDARNDQKGLVGIANGGTLFLDEIDSLSLGAQAKLLRFLQERTYRPLGSDAFLRANVKILTATNKNLNALVETEQFRSDLLFRVNVLQLDLAPLRERREDISLLARHFVNTLCAEHGMPRKTLTAAAWRNLEEYHWPGNIRELYNMLQSAVILCERFQISSCDLSRGWTESVAGNDRASFREARTKAVESFERRYVEDLLRECGGNISLSARIAHKERRAFGRLVKKYQTKAHIKPSDARVLGQIEPTPEALATR
jgi:DNA-binding NtrC family response regulator